MSYEVHREEYRGYTIRIVHDEDASSPRDNDNLATLITWNRNFVSPDDRDGLRDLDAFRGHCEDHPAFVLGLQRLQDGSLATEHYDPDAEHYDGVAYIMIDSAVNDWPVGEIYKSAIACIEGEVKECSDWASGNAWGYEIGDPETDQGPIDSCWGFIGDWEDYCLGQAKEAVDNLVKHARAA